MPGSKKVLLSALAGAASTAFVLAIVVVMVPGVGAEPSELRGPDAFVDIADKAERSAALFEEAGKVLQHPRCINCHPAGDSPFQGEDGSIHEPPVRRGLGGLGAAGMRCVACHTRENYNPARVPGAPGWRLAPRKMAWKGMTLGQICEQLKDPERNGRRDLDEIVHHMEEDALVAYGWEPGVGREPAPGNQEIFGQLIRAWVKTDAVCPE